MNSTFHRFVAPLFCAILFAGPAASASPADTALKTIQNPGGGRIVYGPLGQITPQAAMGQMLHKVSVYCGDRPQMGRLLRSRDGNVLATFFTVTAKNQDGKRVSGFVIAFAPKNGTTTAAVLSDYTDRFPATANDLFARLKQELATAAASTGTPQQGGSSDPGKPAAPPQPLQPAVFPDGTGVIGLPAGWTVIRAQLGDVFAKGPNGEKLRFGMTQAVIDTTNPASRQLMMNGRVPPNFVAIRYGTDPATAFKSLSAQILQKNHKEPSVLNFTKVQDIPMQGGKNYFLVGDVDAHDGQGTQSILVQLIITPPQIMGTWQMTIYEFQAPKQVMEDERATVAAIFPSYRRNNQQVNAIVAADIQRTIEQTNEFIGEVRRDMDNSDRFTAGFSDYLRGETVLLDKEDNSHGRADDDLADRLVRANPNRFEVVPTSEYVQGIDY